MELPKDCDIWPKMATMKRMARYILDMDDGEYKYEKAGALVENIAGTIMEANIIVHNNQVGKACVPAATNCDILVAAEELTSLCKALFTRFIGYDIDKLIEMYNFSQNLCERHKRGEIKTGEMIAEAAEKYARPDQRRTLDETVCEIEKGIHSLEQTPGIQVVLSDVMHLCERIHQAIYETEVLYRGKEFSETRQERLSSLAKSSDILKMVAFKATTVGAFSLTSFPQAEGLASKFGELEKISLNINECFEMYEGTHDLGYLLNAAKDMGKFHAFALLCSIATDRAHRETIYCANNYYGVEEVTNKTTALLMNLDRRFHCCVK